MKLLAALVVLALPAMCGREASKAVPDYRPEDAGSVDHAMCLLGFTAVPVRELATGHHVVEVRLNGRPASFVLDTGANATVLDSRHAEAFGLSGRGVPGGAVGLGGTMKASQARIESFQVGPVPVRTRRIMTTDLSQLSNLLTPIAGRTVHGIVGQDVMKEHRGVIDVSRPIAYLIQSDEDPAPIAAERCEGGREGRADEPKKERAGKDR